MTQDPTPIIAPPRGGTGGQHAAFLTLALLLVLLGLYTLRSFLDPLAWAGIFAIALWPLYCRASRRVHPGRHNLLLPATFTLAVALLFVAPLIAAGVKITIEASAAAGWVRNAEQNGIAEPEMLKHLPAGQAQVDAWWQHNLANPSGAHALLEHAVHGRATMAGRVSAQMLRRVVEFGFMLLTLFFLFRHGGALTNQLRRAATRAFGPGGERVGRQMIASVHGTVNGLVLVGLAEGVVMGVVYAIAGVPEPTVLGALTAVAAMVPSAAIVVMAFAALVKFAAGGTLAGVLVLAVGVTLSFVADHFIRPVLIGGATKLPFLWVLLGILGGLEVWGLIGLFLGPAIMAALILLWREFSAPGCVA